jgi:hypothetical protein
MKMKKLVCILVLICVIMGAAFAQAKPAAPAPAPAKPAAPSRLNAIGLDVFQLMRGVIETNSDIDYSAFYIFSAYERLIAPHFSIGANLDLGFFSTGSGRAKVESKYLSVAGEGRYYPLSENFDKFFLGVTLGYSQLEIDGSTKAGFSGLNTSLKTGYKVLTAKGFYLEPALAYSINKVSTGDWDCGLRLGWAF